MLTDVPGPRSRALAEQGSRSIARPTAPSGGEVFIARGRGPWVEDVDGNRFLDFTGGLGCLVVGHAHPRVVAAVQHASGDFLHTDYSVIPYESYGVLAEAIDGRTGGGRKVAFFNSGAEAVENAVKIARGVTGRPGILCFEGAFHGRTNLALALTHREVPYKKGFGPFAPEIHRVPFPGFNGASLADFEQAASAVLESHAIAAAIVEPELGEGGYVVPPTEFLASLRRLCDAHGTLLITDEVQSGYGRAGTFLAGDQSEVRADLVTLGKSIASGLPLSAVAGDAAVMDVLDPSTLGGTYVGNPVAIAAGLAVLEALDDEDLIARARHIGTRLKEGWAVIGADHSGLITDIRGLGSMVGVEFVSRAALASLREAAFRAGVLTMTAGAEGRVLRHLMPLVITDSELDEAFEVFAKAAAAAS
ncbi:MAG TPA: aspartate aminotransferase family protein [Actinomycetota bacterium]|nr:aspartate aminotransferase family protein [Actinomycetota bacterium]